MIISPIMSNGIVAQTQNVNHINNNAENRNEINYQNVLTTVENEREDAHTTVITSQESNSTDTRHDAREEGKNKYFDNRDKSKKKIMEPEGVIKKTPYSRFETSI